MLSARRHAHFTPCAAPHHAGRAPGLAASLISVGTGSFLHLRLRHCASWCRTGREVVHRWTKATCGRVARDLAALPRHRKGGACGLRDEVQSPPAKLDDEGRLAAAGNEWADRLAKDGAGDDSFQAVMCDWYKTAARTCTDIITYIGNFILRAKTGDRWPDVTPPPHEWQEQDERWKRVKPTLARPHLLVRIGKQWCYDSCGRHASDGPSRAKLARTECVGHPAVALGDEARPQLHLLVQTGSFVWCCRCAARAAKFAKRLGELCLGRPRSQEYARSIRLSNGWHPKENRFLGSPKLFTTQTWSKWRLAHQGAHLAKAGRSELRQAIVRLREARARPCMPDESKHLLLATGQSSGAGSVERVSRRTVRQGCL